MVRVTIEASAGARCLQDCVEMHGGDAFGAFKAARFSSIASFLASRAAATS